MRFEALQLWAWFSITPSNKARTFSPTTSSTIQSAWSNSRVRLVTSASFSSSSSQASAFTCNGPGPKQQEPNPTFASARSGNEEFAGFIRHTCIALLLFLLLAAWTVGLNLTHFFFYDIGMHLLMLHNLDPHTCYTINGVFWTLAIEEQLYLAYFLLLFLRVRWGWGVTIAVCLLARLAWMGFSQSSGSKRVTAFQCLKARRRTGLRGRSARLALRLCLD